MFSIRDGRESDYACIFATWLNSYRHGSHFPRKIPDAIYYAQHHRVIEGLLRRSTVKVATIPEDDEVILGWSCYENGMSGHGLTLPAVVHYVYVKPDFRKSGVATELLREVELSGAMYTHQTFVLNGPLSAKLKRSLFNPYAAMSAS